MCLWANKEITGLWNWVLWNETLSNKNIIYILNFLNSEQRNSLLFYEGFRLKWNLSMTDISRDSYSNIRVAIRNYRTYIAKDSGLPVLMIIFLYLVQSQKNRIKFLLKADISGILCLSSLTQTRSPL